MIKIMIAEDMQVLRESLKFMIESDPEIQVIGLARDGKEILALCDREKPDIVIMDLKMPDLDGFEATKRLKAKFPQIKIMILSTFNDEDSIARAIKHGADGFITKDLGLAELLLSIKSVHLGLGIFQNRVMQNVAKKIKLDDHGPNPEIQFTDREIQVIRLIADGKSYKEIGERLFMAEGTIRNMVYELLGRHQLNDRIQLAVLAAKNRLI